MGGTCRHLEARWGATPLPLALGALGPPGRPWVRRHPGGLSSNRPRALETVHALDVWELNPYPYLDNADTMRECDQNGCFTRKPYDPFQIDISPNRHLTCTTPREVPWISWILDPRCPPVGPLKMPPNGVPRTKY